MASNPSLRVGNRPVKSCTECKQAKVRCGSLAKFPSPCSRCQARNLNCTVDPSFRRTPARKRLEKLSKEVQELRNQQQNAEKAAAETEAAPHEMPSHDLDSNLSSFHLKNTSITKDTVVDAFEIFTTTFYPQLPIIEPVSIDIVYGSSPLLFWTVIVIVVARCPEAFSADMLASIQEPYTEFLKAEIMSAPLPLQHIQALLYLCTWPLPVDHQSRDPSWLYCGIAVNSALYMGLNRHGIPPSLRSVGVASGSAQSRARTWIGCFHVSTTLAMHLGLPPMLHAAPELASIRTRLSQNPVPAEFATQVQIHLLAASFSPLISHSSDSTLSTSLVHLLDTQLNDLRTTHPATWFPTAEFSVLSTKLHFYATVITSARPPCPILLRLASATALRLIHLAHALANNPSPSSFSPTKNNPPSPTLTTTTTSPPPPPSPRTPPKSHFRALAFAALFLLKHAAADESAQQQQQQQQQAVALAHATFVRCSMQPKDEWRRVADLFETLTRVGEGGRNAGLDRGGGVGIVHEAIGAAAEARGWGAEMAAAEEGWEGEGMWWGVLDFEAGEGGGMGV